MRLQKNMAMLIIAFLVGYLPKYVQRAIANQKGPKNDWLFQALFQIGAVF